MTLLFGAVEAGGTKFACAVGTGPDDLRARVRIDTRGPGATLAQVCDFFRRAAATHGPLTAVGVGCFGPVDLDPASPTWGCVTTTPKPGWAGADVAGTLGRQLGVPVGFDTDVNAAALGENRWGAARGLHTFVYLTVGTGIGGGAMVEGRILHGALHPEMGHLRVPHDRAADPYPGGCPYHGDCLEGLAGGPAIRQRWGVPAERLPPDHPAWALEARYLALGLSALVCALSPQRLVLGGGVMAQAHLFPRVRAELEAQLAGYVAAPEVVPPGLGDRAGICGALALAAAAAAA